MAVKSVHSRMKSRAIAGVTTTSRGASRRLQREMAEALDAVSSDELHDESPRGVSGRALAHKLVAVFIKKGASHVPAGHVHQAVKTPWYPGLSMK